VPGRAGSSNVIDIAAGPDGYLYLTSADYPYGLIQLSTSGQFTPFLVEVPDPLHSGHMAGAIITGPDGNLWVGGLDWIVKVDLHGTRTPTPTPTPTPRPTPTPQVTGI